MTHDKYYPFFRKKKLLYEANACLGYQTRLMHPTALPAAIISPHRFVDIHLKFGQKDVTKI